MLMRQRNIATSKYSAGTEAPGTLYARTDAPARRLSSSSFRQAERFRYQVLVYSKTLVADANAEIDICRSFS